jgi:hypothetical protein
MQSEENAASEFPFEHASRDHSLAQPAAHLEASADATPSGIGSRNALVGAFTLIVLGAIATGLIPIAGFDAAGPSRPSQPAPASIETAASAPAPATTRVLQTPAATASQTNVNLFQAIAPSDLETAITGMLIPEPQKKQLRQELTDGTTRLVQIILSDSEVEDGDRVMVESVGYSQQVPLFHRPTVVAVPVRLGMPVTIIGSVDGDNGGITVAVHVHGGTLRLAPLRVGTMVQVPSP